jgi:hypothetical protein
MGPAAVTERDFASAEMTQVSESVYEVDLRLTATGLVRFHELKSNCSPAQSVCRGYFFLVGSKCLTGGPLPGCLGTDPKTDERDGSVVLFVTKDLATKLVDAVG